VTEPRVGLVQMSCDDDSDLNIAHASDLIKEAARAGAELIVLPELFSHPYFCHVETEAAWSRAEPIPGPTTDRLGRLAAELGVWLVAPLYERAPADQLFNAAAVIDPRGSVVGRYRKSSIPLSVLPTWTSREKFYFQPGNTGFTVFSGPRGLRFGVLICYDRHFPEAARALALGGADVIVIPTATGGPAFDTWEIELRAMAIANTCFVAGVNRVGRDAKDPERQEYFGSSLLCSYEGTVLDKAGSRDEAIVIGAIETASMATHRQRLGWFRDRRPDLYGSLNAVGQPK
jgi:predicted amidohydrolase